MYQITIDRAARRSLARLPEQVYARIIGAIRGLAATPRPPGCRKLVDREAWRIRVGRYRVVYEIDDTAHTINVVTVGHRREVYR